MSINSLCITTNSDRPEAESFIGLHKAGVGITVVCGHGATHLQRLKSAGIEVIELDMQGRIDRHAIKVIRTLLKSRSFDIIHMYNNRAVSNGLLASFNINIRRIAYRGIVGNVSFFDPASWMTYLDPRLDRVVCVANAIRDYFRSMRFLGMKLNPQRFQTIYKGHDLSWYQDKPVEPQQFGIPADAFVVGCIANVRPRKGIHILIEAMNHLPDDIPIHILLIGNMDNARLQQQINASRHSGRIHQTGFREDAPAVIAGCHASVLPALKREGLPKVVIESMAYGVPAIVTDSGGSPELIEDNISGLIIPPGSAIAIAEKITYLARNRQRLSEMGEQAKLRIQHCFHTSATVQQTLDLYRELTGQNPH